MISCFTGKPFREFFTVLSAVGWSSEKERNEKVALADCRVENAGVGQVAAPVSPEQLPVRWTLWSVCGMVGIVLVSVEVPDLIFVLIYYVSYLNSSSSCFASL